METDNMNISLRWIALVVITSGILGTLFVVYMYYSETGKFPSIQNIEALFIGFFTGCITGVAIHYLNYLLDAWLPWKRIFTARFLIGLIIDFVVAFGIISLLAWTMARIKLNHWLWPEFSLADEDISWKAIILLFTCLFFYTIVYALLYSYQQYAVAQIQTLERERKQLELQFQALKSQVSPHYLFNSLNTVSSLIYKDPQSAEQFIRRLVQTYQYILATQDKPFVLLKDEVEFVQSYYYLLRIRFQQQLTVEINLPSGIMTTRIPPLTLQILVENAVKHNNLGADKMLFIYITAQDNTYLKVINTKTGNATNVQSFRVGLENIKKRYGYFTDQKIEIKDEDKFTVSLPVIAAQEERNIHKYSA
ncbi:MAG TPA: histidine kinase [Chryseosolibacter sp.]|nr:histidine kinase [Chryseosolibacter sp.]